MNRPNLDITQPGKPTPPPGAAADTVADTALSDREAEPVVAATMEFSPSVAQAESDETVEVTNLAFPRPHSGPEPDATLDMPPTLPPRRRIAADAQTAATLDAEGRTAVGNDGRTNEFSISSLDGSAEIVLNNMPRVEGYKLLSELGRGGMGVVYKARQEKLDRLVALKMVLAGAHASADQLARFLVEAQAVAHLSHNHIVQIYDVGERDGLPFFSLEFVDGGSLQQTIAGKPQPVRYAAKTVKTLCEAIAFAHDKGIIHRDLKPANVLMTKLGEPKITDFGLAKRLEGNSQQTRDGAIMGTPSYMAPEQAWGLTAEIGPAADQHALGAILYEMLTGRPPYQGANPLDTLDQVRNQEPVPPTRLQPKVPVDLETIALKGLQKDAKKRYESARAMAEDLGRYLDGLPIVARPVSFVERSWRWCQRNPRVAALSAAVAALVVASTIGTSAFAAVLYRKNGELFESKKQETEAKVVALSNEAKAVAAKTQEEKAKLAAIEREKEAKAVALAANELTNMAIESQRYMTILANMRLRDIPGTIPLRKELFDVAVKALDRAIAGIDRLKAVGAGSSDSDTMTLRTLASLHQSRGIIYSNLREHFQKVWPEFEEMDRLAERHYALYPDDLEALKNRAASKLTLGEYTFNLKGDSASAEKFFRQGIEYRRMWLAKWPQDDVAKQALSNALGALARMLQQIGRPKDALPLYEEEVKLRETVSVEASRDSEFQRELAGMNEKLGDLQMRLANPDKGRTYYERSFELRNDVAKQFPAHDQAQRDLLLSMQKFGDDYLVERKDPESARKYYQKVVDGFRERLKADATASVPKGDLAGALYRLGTACLVLKDLEASDSAYAESLPLRRELSASPAAKSDVSRMADINLMLGLARCNEYVEASKIAEDLAKSEPKDPYVYVQVAYGYALSASAVERIKPEEKDLAKTYRDSAISALREALKHGWKSADEIATDPDAAPLVGDPRFGPLLDEMRKASGGEVTRLRRPPARGPRRLVTRPSVDDRPGWLRPADHVGEVDQEPHDPEEKADGRPQERPREQFEPRGREGRQADQHHEDRGDRPHATQHRANDRQGSKRRLGQGSSSHGPASDVKFVTAK